MLFCDYHTHSYFSFDGDKLASIDAICNTAISLGITHLAITDHFEANSESEGNFAPFDSDAQYNEIANAKKKYSDKLHLSVGLEIGQAHQFPEIANSLVSRHNYDFIIASIHNLRSLPDFYYMDFKKMEIAEIEELFSKYIYELCELVDKFDWIDTVGHITYIHRYAFLAGRNIQFEQFYPRLSLLFAKMIKKSIALEVNTSSLYKGLGFTMPTKELIALYRDCGGRLITVGSDAHRTENLGRGVRDTFEILKSLGFNKVVCVENGKKLLKNI